MLLFFFVIIFPDTVKHSTETFLIGYQTNSPTPVLYVLFSVCFTDSALIFLPFLARLTQTELTGVLSLLDKDRELQDLLGDAQVSSNYESIYNLSIHCITIAFLSGLLHEILCFLALIGFI
jgi:hypothetical protein